MRLPRPHPALRHRRDPKRRVVEPAAAPAAIDPVEPPSARGPIDEHARVEVADAGLRASASAQQRGLDLPELPTSQPPDRLHRRFNSPQR